MDPVLHIEPHDIRREPAAAAPAATEVTTTDWRKGLPLLAGSGVSLGELKLSDAGSLLSLLTTEEVSRFISPPPWPVH